MKIKRCFLLALAMIMTCAFVGCLDEAKDKTTEDKNNGENVVATSVAVTQILDKLGVKLKGVPTTDYKLPESTKDAVKIGNPMNPDLEIIKSLKPSVVVSVDTLGEDYKNIFKDNNIPSEFVTLTSLDGLKNSITKLSDIFSKKTEGENLLKDLENKEKETKKLGDGKSKKQVMIVFSVPGSMMVASPKSYVGDLVKIAGGENVVKEERLPFYTYNNEEVTKLKPDIVLVMTHGKPEEAKDSAKEKFKNDPTWKNIKAIKEEKVTYLDSEYFGMSANLNVMEALNTLGKILYGDKK
ncbi:heme ABC transporter substrate-binding protein IsdE [Clostridium sardiniense]|uniref:heme ABC transporter substrate-binding protein IsdE n=1 Tax=Clostridium sardiniense TaxID=29369 RepID=UPI003D344A24